MMAIELLHDRFQETVYVHPIFTIMAFFFRLPCSQLALAVHPTALHPSLQPLLSIPPNPHLSPQRTHLDGHGFTRLHIQSILDLAKAAFAQRLAYLVLAHPLGHDDDGRQDGGREGGSLGETAQADSQGGGSMGRSERVW